MDVLLFLAGIFVGVGLSTFSSHRMAKILLTAVEDVEEKEAAQDKKESEDG